MSIQIKLHRQSQLRIVFCMRWFISLSSNLTHPLCIEVIYSIRKNTSDAYNYWTIQHSRIPGMFFCFTYKKKVYNIHSYRSIYILIWYYSYLYNVHTHKTVNNCWLVIIDVGILYIFYNYCIQMMFTRNVVCCLYLRSV